MFRFQVLKRLVCDECLFSWNQTIFLQILRVRLGFEVIDSPVSRSIWRNVSSLRLLLRVHLHCERPDRHSREGRRDSGRRRHSFAGSSGGPACNLRASIF